MTRTFWLLAVAALPAALAGEHGLPVGAKMPAFEAKNQFGNTRTLSDILKPNGAVIVFHRSADWCPYCKAQLVEMEHARKQFEDLGVGLAAISYDSAQVLSNFADRQGIHVELLSDPDSKIIREVKLLNETVAKGPFFGVPYPCTFVLDENGVIKAKYFEEDFRQHFTAANILTRQYNVLPVADRHTATGKQLEALVSASNLYVHAGERVALALTISLKPGMHVYAPGVENYIPIEWKLNYGPAFVAHELTMPPSKKLLLPAINETVPVYQGSFRILRDITIADEAKVKPLADSDGRFTVEGTLRYQACDDHMCYLPQEMPVVWTFVLQPLDPERVPKELQRH